MEIFGWIILGVIALVIIGLIIWAIGILQPFRQAEKFIRGNPRPDPGRHEKAAGHDRPTAWFG